jgi:crotonobetainyl-CoA:carnitine CoA-transferase CaiB-like acyl-CoA transferase
MTSGQDTPHGGFGLLSGVKVLECALLLNGGQVGMFLADLGADVIKIEDAVRGDYLRDIMGQVAPRESPAHLQVNKNKKSVAIDIRKEEGRALFFELLKDCDIFVDGLRAGACDALGIGYAAQRAVKPDIIYAQCTGYGAEGPYANIPTHGYQMTALPGGMPSRFLPDGLVERARGVQYMGGVEDVSAASNLGAQATTMTALAALHHRDRTGEGSCIDVSAADAVLASAWTGMVYNLNYDRITEFKSLDVKQDSYEAKWPNGSVRYQLYRTADDKVLLLGVIERKFWVAFCKAVDREDLIDTMRQGEAIDYGEDKPWLRLELRDIVRARPLAEWMEMAARLGIPMGPAHRIEDVADDPHMKSRGVIVEIGADDPAGPFDYIGFPAKIAGDSYGPPQRAPKHGQDTIAVLGSLGLSRERIDALRDAGIIHGDVPEEVA